MGERKPNILEVDGLIIRGRNGEVRARIIPVTDAADQEYVTLQMFGASTSPPEPAVVIYVDAEGRAMLDLRYAGTDGEGDTMTQRGIKATSGDLETSPYLAIWGRGPGLCEDVPAMVLPGQSEEAVIADLTEEINDLVQRRVDEHKLKATDISDIFETLGHWSYRRQVEEASL